MINTPPQKHVQLYHFCVCVLSHVQMFLTPSMEFSWQEYWSGLLLPTPVDLPNPGTSLNLLHLVHQQADSLLLGNKESCHLGLPPGKPIPFLIRLENQKWKRNYLNSLFPANLSSLIWFFKFYNLGFFFFN